MCEAGRLVGIYPVCRRQLIPLSHPLPHSHHLNLPSAARSQEGLGADFSG